MQSFEIVTPDGKERVSICGSRREGLFRDFHNLVELLAVPYRPSVLEDIYIPQSTHYRDTACNTTTKPVTVARSTFLNLPNEVKDLIFDKLSLEDALLLSTTNRSFWGVGRRQIKTRHMSSRGRWAGKRLICVGNDLRLDDCLPGMLTKEEEHESFRQRNENGENMTLFDALTCPTSTSYAPPVLQGPFVPRVADRISYFHMQNTYRVEVARALQPLKYYFFPSDQQWILRNLTTKEYVRAEAIAPDPKYAHGPIIHYLGFGEIVASRICWSSSPIDRMRSPGNIHRGIWAGHRFDITTTERHQDELARGEWTDFSDEVAEELGNIWESEYGKDRREIFLQRTIFWV